MNSPPASTAKKIHAMIAPPTAPSSGRDRSRLRRPTSRTRSSLTGGEGAAAAPAVPDVAMSSFPPLANALLAEPFLRELDRLARGGLGHEARTGLHLSHRAHAELRVQGQNLHGQVALQEL